MSKTLPFPTAPSLAVGVQSRDPATGEVWATFPTATPNAVAEVLHRARVAQPAWAALEVSERVALLARAGRRLYERRREVAGIISRENGKPEVEALAAEVVTTLDIFRFYVRNSARLLAEERTRSSALALWRKRISITRNPYGVVAVISPWNYPFMLPAGIVAPALVAGNAVVLKPSELTPSTATLLHEVFMEGGVPPEIFQLVHGGGETGNTLVQGDVDKVFFTGSVATGRRVAHACAERLVPCALELGGSDPALVLADADLEHAASGILWGRFANCGQTCVAPKRVFVASEVYDRFVAAMAERVRQLHVLGSDDTNNDPTSPQHDVTDDMYDMYDMGALIRESQRESLAALRDDALQRGGKIHGGDGNAAIANVALGGNRFSPTLLLDLPANARALHEETFGPLLPIIRVSDESAMIAMANDSEFGLSASVWTRDRARGRAIAKRLDAGTVVINDVALIAGVAEVPHGGVKQSGTGRAHGAAGLEECVRTKTIVDDIFSSWRQPWWFGYGTRALERMDGYVRLSHGGTVRQRLSGIASTIALVFRPERPL